MAGSSVPCQAGTSSTERVDSSLFAGGPTRGKSTATSSRCDLAGGLACKMVHGLLTSGLTHHRCIRIWSVPSPVAGDVERLVLWTQVLTGMELNSEGVVNTLDAEQWRERRERLEKLGGPP